MRPVSGFMDRVLIGLMKYLSHRTLNKLLILTVFVSQAVCALYLLSPTELLNHEPLYTGDYPAYYYRCMAVSEFLAKSGKTTGYDPYLKAGYIFPSAMGDGSRVMQILARPLPPALKVFVIKWYVMAVFLIMPLILYLTARNLDMSEQETAILLTSGLMLWWIPAFPYHLAIFGLINFVLASYLSLYIAALVYKLTQTEKLRPTLLLSVLIPFAVLVHIISIVSLLPLMACIVLFARSQKIYSGLLLFLLLIVVLNGFWLLPYLRDIVPSLLQSLFTVSPPVVGDAPPIRHLTETELLKNFKTLFTGVTLPLAVVAAVGFYRLRKRREIIKFYIFLLPAVFYALLNYFGSLVPGVVLLQPLRFKLPMLLFLLIPMAIGIGYLYEKAASRYKNLAIALPVLLGLLCVATVLVIPKYRSRDDLNAQLSGGMRTLLEWIKTNTTREARILLEGDDLSIHLRSPKYQDGHLPMLLPYLTQREFISTTFPIVDFPGFSDGIMFTQDVRKYGLDDLKIYFDLFNIKWIVCWSPQAIETFMAYPDYLTVIGKIDIFYIFAVNRQPSYYIKGSGEVEADYSTLRLNHIKADNGSIIIKYHWADGLRTIPARAINAISIGPDPDGFIQILDPPESLVVQYTPESAEGR